MGVHQNQNQNLSSGFSQPDVSHWKSTLSEGAADTIVVLGVLTFILQLGLVLFIMRRFWRLDNKVRTAVKHPDAQKLFVRSHFHMDVYEQSGIQMCDNSAASTSASVKEDEASTDSLFAPSVHWDYVQPC